MEIEDLTPIEMGESFGTWKIMLKIIKPNPFVWQDWVQTWRKAYKRRWDFDDAWQRLDDHKYRACKKT